jgi:hypothetical protein
MLQGLQPTKRDAYGRLILGDIITSVNGKKITNGSDLYRILDQCKVDDTVWCFGFFNILILMLSLSPSLRFSLSLSLSVWDGCEG